MADDHRHDDYRAARIGAALALVGILSILLLLDALVHEYQLQSVTLVGLLTSIATLLGVEGLSVLRNRRDD